MAERSATSKRPGNATNGAGRAKPFVQLAVLCERAQQDQYGSLSILNILEQLVAGTSDPNAPDRMPTFRFKADLAVAFVSGELRGERALTIVPETPSGERMDPVTQQVEFRGEDSRVVFISNLSLDISEAGVYWFDVLLEGRRLTRIPLRVRYERNVPPRWKAYTLEY